MLEAFTWYKQSTFQWKGEKLVVYIDSWGLTDDLQKADLLLITHAHGDHFVKEDIARVKTDKTVILAPHDVARELSGNVKPVKPGDRIEAAGVKIEAVPAYNIDPARLEAHPKANNWVGYVLQLGGNTYYHAGDTDHLPELDRIRTDVAFLPIGDGGYVMTVDEAAGMGKGLKPKFPRPLHYGFFPRARVPAGGGRLQNTGPPIDTPGSSRSRWGSRSPRRGPRSRSAPGRATTSPRTRSATSPTSRFHLPRARASSPSSRSGWCSR